jgi:hypothetical protein
MAMSRDDIVTRLRDWSKTICMVRGDEAPGSKARLAIEAAELIEALRTVNDEVFAASIKSVRDTAEMAIELREARRERDEARRMACEALAAGDDDGASEYARLRGWDCFAHTEVARLHEARSEPVRGTYSMGGGL